MDVRRHKQRQSLRESAGAWKTEDHPELAQGGAAYVEQIRSEPDPRYEKALNLLDTSVIFDHRNGRLGRTAYLERLLDEGHSFGCCPVNLTEVFAGLRSDATIAAVALEYRLPLLTDNRKHFPMAGLQLYPLP